MKPGLKICDTCGHPFQPIIGKQLRCLGECQKRAYQKWRRGNKGKAVVKRWNQGAKGRIAKRKYMQSAKGKASRREYNQTIKGRESMFDQSERALLRQLDEGKIRDVETMDYECGESELYQQAEETK